MKTLTFNTVKKVSTVLRHVFIEGNADNVELAIVYVPLVIVGIACILIFGHAPKY